MDTAELISNRNTLRPKFIYGNTNNTSLLHRMNLLTGEQTTHQIPSCQFMWYSHWSELPGGSLIITGGSCGGSVVRKVVKIDTLREFAVSFQPPMHTARRDHAAVYHSQYLYVLGGRHESPLRECERLVSAESRWEELPALPVASFAMSVVELDNCLYACGGEVDGGNLDTVQKFSLDGLTWELMRLKLPKASRYFPCFKTDTQVYLVIEKTLYSFTPFQVKPIKTLRERIWCDYSCYSRGTLYYVWRGRMMSLAVSE
jgi:hypothetical protein